MTQLAEGRGRKAIDAAADEMTERIVACFAHPCVNIWAHPTGRILLGREGYTLDLEAIIDAAAARGVCIEINANPSRLDLDWRLLHRARDKGIKIPVNPDAHVLAGLDDMRYGIGVARKGWLRREDVLNTMTSEEIQAYFKNRRSKKGT